MSPSLVRNCRDRLRHVHRIPVAILCFGMLLTGLAALPSDDLTNRLGRAGCDGGDALHGQTISDANTPRATTTALHPCRAGTLMRLVATTKNAAITAHQAYVLTPNGTAAQALLHPTSSPAVGKHPAVICLAAGVVARRRWRRWQFPLRAANAVDIFQHRQCRHSGVVFLLWYQ